jgi:two-component system, chemotaxis family, chemotaxis protein CheY
MMFTIKKILAVDDSEIIHKLYDFLFARFRSQGFQLLHAYDGQTGLERFRENLPIDVVLLDINMPVMGGLEFLKALRSERAGWSVPVIVISTKGQEGDTEKALKIGADAYLTKPFQPMELLTLAMELHSKGRKGGSASAHTALSHFMTAARG